MLRNTWERRVRAHRGLPGAGPGLCPRRRALRRGPLGVGVLRLLLRPPARPARLQEERQPAVRLRAHQRRIPGHPRRRLRAAPRLPRRDPSLHGRPGDRRSSRRPSSSGRAPEQTWIENAAGAIQEVFYRSIQVARDRFGAAICVGTSAVYRRAALEPHGGPTLIPYAEDVHTGLDVRRAGWSMVYLPIVLSTGICPDNLDAFVRQQYRWCTGNAGIVFSRRLWAVRDDHPGPAHLHLRVLLLRLHRPAHASSGPSSRSSCWRFFPARSGCGTSSSSRPAMIAGFVLYPLWHRSTYGPSVWPLGIARGWAHVFSIWDSARGKTMSWHPSRTPGSALRRFRRVRHRVERRHGAAVGSPGHLADGDPGFGAVRGPGVLRRAEPRGREPRHLPGGQDGMRSAPGGAGWPCVAAAVAITFTGARFIFVPSPPPSAHASLPPDPGLLRGRLRARGAARLRADRRVRPWRPGKQPNLVGYYSGWAEPFATSFARDGAQPRHHPVRADRPHLRVGRRRSPPAPTTSTCARTPTASGTSATRSSSASGTR